MYRKEIRTLLLRVASSSKAKFGSFELEMAPAHSNQPAPVLEKIANVDPITGVHVIDGKQYVDCHFNNATLRFGGTKPVSFIHCQFGDVRWEMDGPAALTLQFLSAMYRGAGDGGKQLVERTLDQIRQGKHLGKGPEV